MFTADGTTLAVSGADGMIRVLDLITGQILATLEDASVRALAFGPDGTALASASAERVSLWDVASGEKTAVLAADLGGTVTDLAYSPRGDVLALAADAIEIWDLKATAVRAILQPAEEAVTEIAFSADGRFLISLHTSSRITLWRMDANGEPRQLASPTGAPILSAVFSPVDTVLAAADGDGNLIVWTDEFGTAKVLGGHADPIKRLSFRPDGQMLASEGEDAQIVAWDFESGRVTASLPARFDPVVSGLAFSKDGRILASVGDDGDIYLWDVSSGRLTRVLIGHTGLVEELAFGPSGQTLASIDEGRTVMSWDLDTGRPVFSLQLPVAPLEPDAGDLKSPARTSGLVDSPAPVSATASAGLQDTDFDSVVPGSGPAAPSKSRLRQYGLKGITSLTVSSDGVYFASGGADYSVRLWDSTNGNQVKLLEGHSESVSGLVFHPTKRELFSASRDSTARRWEQDSGTLKTNMLALEQPVRTVAISADGKYVAVGGDEVRIGVWDARNGKLKKILSGGHSSFVNAVAFKPGAFELASGDDDGFLVAWKENGELRGKPKRAHTVAVNALIYIRNGSILVSAGEDINDTIAEDAAHKHTIRFWNTKNGKLEYELDHGMPVRALVANAQGTYLASAGLDGCIYLWKVGGGRQPLNMLCRDEKTLPLSPINSLALLPDQRLLAGAEDGTITAWDISDVNAPRELKVIVPTPLEQTAQLRVLPLRKAGAEDEPGRAVQSGTRPWLATVFRSVVGGVLEWLVPTANAQELPDPNQGPGGPILVIHSGASLYGTYYAEILRTEGFNAFSVADATTVTQQILDAHDVVILADIDLSPNQANVLTNWVEAGGNLIAMRPDADIAGLFGLNATGSTLSEGYLLIDTSVPPGGGLPDKTLQFHGTATQYGLTDATEVATLYADASTATDYPAVTLRAVGSNGGHAAAFAYDLATSVVYTRQGNPAWASQERDGFPPQRSNDRYYGDAIFDSTDDWVDFRRISIPQADEQQRLLANLIVEMTRDQAPLPRFWYFPRGEKAVVIMTGDDHGNNGTAGRWDQFLAASAPGCSVEDWECVRGTSYMYPSTPMTDAQAAAYEAQGFEVGLHLSTSCADFTEAQLDSFYDQQVDAFSIKWPSAPPPTTQRHHCIAWTDWVTGAKVQLNYGIRLDTSYYFWPPGWVLNRPGFLTGSGMPMRFADLDGSLIDVYQAASQMTDESGQEYPYTIDTLLDRALGSLGYYGAYTINAHTDVAQIPESDAVVSSALARGVPIITSRQMLEWLDGRNGSTFDAIAWDGQTLSFGVTTGAGANGLETLVPLSSGNEVVTAVAREGNAVPFSLVTRKGIAYASFDTVDGGYTITYGADATLPTVTDVSPEDGAVDVDHGTSVSAVFSEPMNASSIDGSSFQLTGPQGVVSADVAYEAESRTATLNPTAALDPGTTYTATLYASGVRDLSGNGLASNVNWAFTTKPPLNCPCSVWSTSDTPAVASENDPNAVELGVKFESNIDGFITGVRFYKGSANTGTHVGSLWTANGSRLATATFTNETSTGWQEVTFATPVAITAGTLYVASYHAPNGGYSRNSGYFASSGIENDPLRFLADGENGGNGVYRYGGGGFPNQTYNATNYWVDVVFTTDVPPDTTPPQVTASSPAVNATAIALSTDVTVSFDEPMDAATINDTNFQLLDAGSNGVPATVSYDPTSFTAVLSPDSPLAELTTHTATVTGGAAGPADLAGNRLAADYQWSFETGEAATCPCGVWDDTVVPGNPSENDPSAVELGVKFTADVDGYVTGIRFYKGAGNTGTHVGNLWTSNGTLLASAVFTNETATGWQRVDFASPVAINAGTLYVASYHAPNGNYAADPLYFANSGVENGYLNLLQNGVSGGNGVYLYGAGGFPTFSWQAANYWVDVLFETDAGPDTTPPTVVSTNPVEGATAVSPTRTVSASFSEAMDGATISSQTFELRDEAGAIVPVTVAYDAGTDRATLTPDADLLSGQTYTATLVGGTTPPHVTDLAGNPLAADLSWSFSTAIGGQSLWDDGFVPSVVMDPNTSPIELGVKFQTQVDGQITGIRFYKGPENTGEHVGSVWTLDGQLLAQAVFGSETASGWQQVDFASPVDVAAGAVYVASYHTDVGRYSIDEGYFSANGYAAGYLYALADGENGGNGLFTLSASPAFPTETFASSNYWVDVVFTDTDSTAPTVTATTPAEGDTGISIATQVKAGFSEAMDAATIGTANFELRDGLGTLVTAAVAYDAGTRTATLTPADPLAAGVIHSATVKGGAGGPTDLVGNVLASDLSWSFTTAEAVCCTVWTEADQPANPSENDPSAVEVGVKFTSDQDGFITGIRFYKGTGNTGPHVGNLWSLGGTLLGSASFESETAAGWQQADFASPAAISADTIYVASYHAPNGSYAADASYFANAGVDNPPLHLLQDGVSGGNGVYAYGPTSSFPGSSFLATNYWVDVVFSTDNGQPPSVTQTVPADGGIDHPASAPVTATFNEPIDPATLSFQTFELTDTAGAPVAATVSYDSASRTATLTPSSALAPTSDYTALLRGGTTDPRIKDLTGEPLPSDYLWAFTTGEPGPCDAPPNPIVAENCLAGNPPSDWDVSGAGDPSIQGFATDISVDLGETVFFKVDTNAPDYRLDIYRLGYYGGQGARKVATVAPSATLPQVQPSCLEESSTGLIDCGNWSVSASWTVPADATSGVYVAKAVRADTSGASHIPFVVRDDAGTSDVLFQTADTTWQAYNTYGGNSLYTGTGPGTGGSADGRAYAVSYNRPFNTRSVANGQDWLFNSEYPMIRWLEANGYDVSYFTGIDADRFGSLIPNHRAFLSVGHDEYWSGDQRANVEAARDAGVHLAFFSGNEVFWKTRWEPSVDGSGTPYRTLVCYKDTHENAVIDPAAPIWTGTWRDPRFSPPGDGGNPENALTGTIFTVNAGATTSIRVPAEDGKMRLWRNTSIANLPPGSTATLPFGTLGYEWDEDLDNGFRPPGIVRMSTTTVTGAPVLVDYGSTFGSGEATHHLTLYRAASGALVFGAGTVQWSWGLDANHDRGSEPPDVRMQQATVNLFADMGMQPETLQPGLVAATASSDSSPPASSIGSPTDGASLTFGTPINVTGIATDIGGVVGGVEVSVDGGSTWHPANGREAWSYTWTPSVLGAVNITSRAVDDSGNLEAPAAGVDVTVVE